MKRMARRVLTRADLLGADWRPETVKRMEGRAGRRPKWTVADFGAEHDVAIEVELERMRRGIPPTRGRTPADVFKAVAAKHKLSRRSAERFYAVHRDTARTWARILTEVMPALRRQYRELVELYGDGINAAPGTWLDRIYRLRADLPPSEISEFDRRVRSIIGEKRRNSAR